MAKWADIEDDDDIVAAPTTGRVLWADADDEDADFPVRERGPTRTLLMKEGDVKTYLEYVQKGEDMYKVYTKIREIPILSKTNPFIEARKKWGKFGKTFDDTTGSVSNYPVRSDEMVTLELNKDRKIKVVGDEEKFWEQSISKCDAMFASANAKAWNVDEMRRQRAEVDDLATAAAPATSSATAAGGPQGNRYVPPSMRTGTGGAGGGRDDAGNENTLRVQNLSEDVREGDVQQLFTPFGAIRRLFLAKYREGDKEGLCKGFAFVTFRDRVSCDKAMEALHGHGYDSLILSVTWAKPRED